MISTIEAAADHVFTMIMIMIVALLMYFSRLTLGRELKQFATILADSWLRQGWSKIWIFQDTVCFQRATFESLASLEALVSSTVAACSNFLGFQSCQQQCAAVSRQLLLQYYRFNVKLQHHEISYFNMQYYAIPTRPYNTGQYVNITI